MTVRRCSAAEISDAWAIVEEYCDAIGVVEREDRAKFTKAYFGDDSGVWLARADDDGVGCIALRRLNAEAGEVKRLYLKPAWRGRLIAHHLLDALHNFARAHGYQALYLDSKDDLETAIHFYRLRGYEDCARYNDNPQATVFLRRPVVC